MVSTTQIKTIQDIMRKDRGINGDAQRIEQLVWMIFLKVLDDREQRLEVIRQDLAGLGRVRAFRSADVTRLTQTLQGKLAEWRDVLRGDVPQARQILRALSKIEDP